MQNIRQIPLIDFKRIILDLAYQKFKVKRPCTWYTFIHETFLDYLYNVRKYELHPFLFLFISIVFNVFHFLAC